MRSPTFLGSFLRAVRIRSICALSSGFWPDSAASSALAASNWGSSFRASWYSAFASGSFRSEGRTYPFNLRAFVGLLAGQRGELGSRRLELGIELQGLLVLRLRLRQLQIGGPYVSVQSARFRRASGRTARRARLSPPRTGDRASGPPGTPPSPPAASRGPRRCGRGSSARPAAWDSP